MFGFRTASALTAAAFALAPLVIAPSASADVCDIAGQRHYSEQNCADFTGAGVVQSQHSPYVQGELPCWTVNGVMYYTPPGHSC